MAKSKWPSRMAFIQGVHRFESRRSKFYKRWMHQTGKVICQSDSCMVKVPKLVTARSRWASRIDFIQGVHRFESRRSDFQKTWKRFTGKTIWQPRAVKSKHTDTALLESTEQKVFPFLELAPELRNRIYEYALVQNRFEGQDGYALLRVCKEIYQEAVGMFYFQSTFCIKAATWEQRVVDSAGTEEEPKFDIETQRLITGDMTHCTPTNTTLGTFNDVWPTAMLKVRRIELHIDPFLDATFPSHILYSLATFLHRSELKTQELCIKTLQVAARPQSSDELHFTYPIARMPPHLRITYHGVHKDAINYVHKFYIDGDRANPELPLPTRFDGFAWLKKMEPKVKKHLKIWRKQANHEECEGDWEVFTKGRAFVHRQLKLAHIWLQSKYMASFYSDRNMMLCMMVLGRWVELMDAGLPFGDEERERWKDEINAHYAGLR